MREKPEDPLKWLTLRAAIFYLTLSAQSQAQYPFFVFCLFVLDLDERSPSRFG
jgi:hypothetical protein